jgi:hypothetical protein
MSFYVPVGPRGVVLRVGMMLTRSMGSVVYWWASRRRASLLALQARAEA